MNNDIIRHKLLRILAGQHAISDPAYNTETDEPIGVSFDDIYKYIKCDKNEFRIAISELYENNEINSHDAKDIVGLYATDKGVSACSNEKYKRLYVDSIIKSIKNVVQIFMPVLSLVVAILALIITLKSNNKSDNKQLQKAEERVLSIEKRVNKLELETKTYYQPDSLKTE